MNEEQTKKVIDEGTKRWPGLKELLIPSLEQLRDELQATDEPEENKEVAERYTRILKPYLLKMNPEHVADLCGMMLAGHIMKLIQENKDKWAKDNDQLAGGWPCDT